MIRVGFVLATDSEWIGGVNYLINLLQAVYTLQAPRIEPVLLVSSQTPRSFLLAFPPFETVRSPEFDNSRILTKVRKAAKATFGRDFILERVLRSHGIRVLSHSGHLGSWSPIPTIQWLPDFQHRRLPQFFQPKELLLRDRIYGSCCRNASTILLSSFDARKDLAEFAPDAVARSAVLHFVSGFGAAANAHIPRTALSQTHGVDGPYFHLPNQFWAHKNHRIVLDALTELRRQGRDLRVVATGHTRDYRQPHHFEALMREVAALGLSDNFRVLGLVPYDDLTSLMRHAVAIINPSLFEGWSTTVEEAKSLGKTILLSDIPVHREQAPELGQYFNPANAAELASAMATALDRYDPSTDAACQAAAAKALPGRVAEFARGYEDIVLSTVATREIT